MLLITISYIQSNIDNFGIEATACFKVWMHLTVKTSLTFCTLENIRKPKSRYTVAYILQGIQLPFLSPCDMLLTDKTTPYWKRQFYKFSFKTTYLNALENTCSCVSQFGPLCTVKRAASVPVLLENRVKKLRADWIWGMLNNIQLKNFRVSVFGLKYFGRSPLRDCDSDSIK
jgi:hypothetical protein